MITTTWRLDRLSREWVGPIRVLVGEEPASDWTYAILPFDTRPSSVADVAGTPDERGGLLGILVGPETSNVLAPDRYRIWVRCVAGEEAPVFDAVGVLVIT